MEEKTLTKTIKVEEEQLAVSMGSGGLAVLATPAVVALMENAAFELCEEILNNDELTTVGTAISIEHTSPTPLGAEISATAVLKENDGRFFNFEVSASDAKGIIAKGTHTRVSVKAEKFQKKRMKSLMVKHDYILFDLDGTISKSADGIKYSLENAIKQMGKPVPDLSDYTLYIGPPLIDTFLNICHFSQEESLRGVEVYRDIYNTEGKFVNKAYDGIEELLKKIKADGKKIAVCSSKYELFAKEIIEILGLSQYFDAVCGSTLDGSRKDKKDLIPYALNSLGTSLEKDRKNAVIIGDTYFDTKGAVQTGIDFVGASYGYGDIEQMKKEGGKVFADTPIEIYNLI